MMNYNGSVKKQLWKNKKYALSALITALALLAAVILAAPVRAEGMGEGQASWSEPAPSAALTEQETAGGQEEASSALPAEEPAPTEETAQPTPPQDPIPETGEIPLDAAHFPDPAFRAFLAAYDADGSGGFSEEERMGITRLDLRNKGIASLEGIGAFPSLTCLNCIGNSLKALPMEQLTGLTSLLCNENALTELDLSQTPGLKVLHCHDNLITSLDLSHLPALWELACGDNPFTSLDLSHNPELAWFLYMGGPLETLTLSGNEGLIDLWCAYSRVSRLDLSQAPNLELLGLENSRFTYLDLSANPKLTQVLAARNLLLAVDMGSAAPQMDLSDQQPLEIQMGEGRTSFDLASLGLPIDPACLSQPEGARLKGTLLEDIPPEGTVRYRYTQGAASFTASLRFHVSNGWLEPLTLEDWTYGQPAHTPHSDAQFGEPVYTYSDSPDGTFTAQVPSGAGTWFVKASVPPTEGHAGLEDVREFHILKAEPPYTLPTGLTAPYGSTLGSLSLGEGFSWKLPDQRVGSVGQKNFAALFTPEDTQNYLTLENLSIPVLVTPRQAQDSWVSPVNSLQDAEALTVRDGQDILRRGVDYIVESSQKGDQVVLTILFQGNYQGKVLRQYTLAPSLPGQWEEDRQESLPPSALQPLPGPGLTTAPQQPAVTPQPTAAPGKPQTGENTGLAAQKPDRPVTPTPTVTPPPGQPEGTESRPPVFLWWLILLILVLSLTLAAALLLRQREEEEPPEE